MTNAYPRATVCPRDITSRNTGAIVGLFAVRVSEYPYIYIYCLDQTKVNKPVSEDQTKVNENRANGKKDFSLLGD